MKDALVLSEKGQREWITRNAIAHEVVMRIMSSDRELHFGRAGELVDYAYDITDAMIGRGMEQATDEEA